MTATPKIDTQWKDGVILIQHLEKEDLSFYWMMRLFQFGKEGLIGIVFQMQSTMVAYLIIGF